MSTGADRQEPRKKQRLKEWISNVWQALNLAIKDIDAIAALPLAVLPLVLSLFSKEVASVASLILVGIIVIFLLLKIPRCFSQINSKDIFIPINGTSHLEVMKGSFDDNFKIVAERDEPLPVLAIGIDTSLDSRIGKYLCGLLE